MANDCMFRASSLTAALSRFEEIEIHMNAIKIGTVAAYCPVQNIKGYGVWSKTLPNGKETWIIAKVPEAKHFGAIPTRSCKSLPFYRRRRQHLNAGRLIGCLRRYRLDAMGYRAYQLVSAG
jgi:hypothetical protein